LAASPRAMQTAGCSCAGAGDQTRHAVWHGVNSVTKGPGFEPQVNNLSIIGDGFVRRLNYPVHGKVWPTMHCSQQCTQV